VAAAFAALSKKSPERGAVGVSNRLSKRAKRERNLVVDAAKHHVIRRAEVLSRESTEELRRVSEDLVLAVKRADEALREAPTLSSRNSAIFREARMADRTVSAMRRRIAEIEGA
jgi:hypothetical protein